MAHLRFRLKKLSLNLDVTEKSDEWGFLLTGKIERILPNETFIVKSGDQSYDGFSAITLVHIKKRPPRNELPGISAAKPFDKTDDEYRDSISVICGGSEPYASEPIFDINISLPPDAYQLVIDADWMSNTIMLQVATGDNGKSLTHTLYSEITWLTDKQHYEYLKEVSISFQPASRKKLVLKKRYFKALNSAENMLTLVEQKLATVDRVTESIGELRATIIKIAWVLAAVLVVTAFIR